MAGAVEISRAASSDASELTAIATAAKRHWSYPEQWIDAWNSVLTITPEFLAENEVYLARGEKVAAGFYAFIRHEGKLRLEHCWVRPSQMHRGIGRALFRHAAERARQLGFTCFEIEADPNAEPFYLKMGAARVGETSTSIFGVKRILPLLIYGEPGGAKRLRELSRVRLNAPATVAAPRNP